MYREGPSVNVKEFFLLVKNILPLTTVLDWLLSDVDGMK